MKPVTDPALLSQLDQRGPVTDAALLAQLEGQDAPAANPPATDKPTLLQRIDRAITPDWLAKSPAFHEATQFASGAIEGAASLPALPFDFVRAAGQVAGVPDKHLPYGSQNLNKAMSDVGVTQPDSGSGWRTGGNFAGGALVPLPIKNIPAGTNVGDTLRTSAENLMQSAVKPTIEQLRTGKASRAVKTLLDEGVNATKGGVEKLRGRIDGINDEIVKVIDSSSGTINKQQVLRALEDTKDTFIKQVSPTSDLAAISRIADDFLAHPMATGETIPAKLAQQLKQGTYKTLSKKYGQIGSAETEAQKALARGLKEEISKAEPAVAALNARESSLINAMNVAERRALMDANKNPMGLSLLAQNPVTWAMFMADKSALFKSIAARMVNAAGKGADSVKLPESLALPPRSALGASAATHTSVQNDESRAKAEALAEILRTR